MILHKNKIPQEVSPDDKLGATKNNLSIISFAVREVINTSKISYWNKIWIWILKKYGEHNVD